MPNRELKPGQRAVDWRYLSSATIVVLLIAGVIGVGVISLTMVDTTNTATVGLVTTVWLGLVGALTFALKAHQHVMTDSDQKEDDQ